MTERANNFINSLKGQVFEYQTRFLERMLRKIGGEANLVAADVISDPEVVQEGQKAVGQCSWIPALPGTRRYYNNRATLAPFAELVKEKTLQKLEL